MSEQMNIFAEELTAMKRLTAKQRLFVRKYAVLNNGYKAALAAGYSERSARQQASRLLTYPNIQRALEMHRQRIRQELDDAGLSTIRGIHGIANLDIRRLYHSDGRLKKPDELDEDVALALGSVSFEEVRIPLKDGDSKIVTRVDYKLESKLKAFEQLAKIYGLYQSDGSGDDPDDPAGGGGRGFNVNINIERHNGEQTTDGVSVDGGADPDGD